MFNLLARVKKKPIIAHKYLTDSARLYSRIPIQSIKYCFRLPTIYCHGYDIGRNADLTLIKQIHYMYVVPGGGGGLGGWLSTSKYTKVPSYPCDDHTLFLWDIQYIETILYIKSGCENDIRRSGPAWGWGGLPILLYRLPQCCQAS